MAFKMKGKPYGSPVKYKKSPVKDKKEAWAGKMEDGTPEWDHEAYAHNQAEKEQKKKEEEAKLPPRVRCTAIKSNGERCKNNTRNKNEKCYAHQ